MNRFKLAWALIVAPIILLAVPAIPATLRQSYDECMKNARDCEGVKDCCRITCSDYTETMEGSQRICRCSLKNPDADQDTCRGNDPAPPTKPSMAEQVEGGIFVPVNNLPEFQPTTGEVKVIEQGSGGSGSGTPSDTEATSTNIRFPRWISD